MEDHLRSSHPLFSRTKENPGLSLFLSICSLSPDIPVQINLSWLIRTYTTFWMMFTGMWYKCIGTFLPIFTILTQFTHILYFTITFYSHPLIKQWLAKLSSTSGISNWRDPYLQERLFLAVSKLSLCTLFTEICFIFVIWGHLIPFNSQCSLCWRCPSAFCLWQISSTHFFFPLLRALEKKKIKTSSITNLIFVE